MTEETYTPEEDVTEAGPDGIPRLVAAKGVPIPMEEAKRRGLVKEAKQTGPRELKQEIQPRDLAQGEMLEAGELPPDSQATGVTFTPAPAFEEAVNEEPPKRKKG
jgi:hypothetical protein